MRVIYIDLIFVSIGFLVWIFTSLAWIIGVAFGVGLIIGATMEYIRYNKAKMAAEEQEKEAAKQNKQKEGYDLDEVFEYEWTENKQDDGIYVKTDFTNRYIEEYSIDNNNESSKISLSKGGKKRKRQVSVTGSTRVYHKKKNGALMLEKRSLYIFEDYQGYEVGGGLSSFAGFIITAIVQLIKIGIDSQSDTETDWFLNIFILILITAVLACFGCIIEIELRKNNILPPNKQLFSTTTSIALHEIQSMDTYSIGFHQNVKANISKKGSSKLFIQKVAIKWFRCIIGVWKLIRFIFIAAYINTAFVLFIFVFIITGLQFELAINKGESLSYLSFAITIMLWISALFGFYAIFYTSQACSKCYPDQEYNRLSVKNRINQKKQLLLFILFIISTVLLVLSGIMMTTVVSNTYKIQIAQSDSKVNTEIIDKMLCEVTDPETLPDSSKTTMTTKGDLCDDDNKNLIVSTLVFLCITWYILLVAAYGWRKHDRGIFKLNFANKYFRVWRQYSAIRIGLKRATNKFWPGSSRDIIIELDKQNALILHEYLNNVVPWFSQQGHHTCVTKHNYQY